MSVLNRLTRLAGSLLRPARLRSGAARGGTATVAAPGAGVPGTTVEYAGALPPLEYEPAPDRQADPGEIVWAWVPYEENDGRGKDRPVLVIAHHPGGYLGLQTTSKDHNRDRADEAHWGRHWFDIGSGAWDRQGRESEVRLDRVLYLPESAVRREGAGLDKIRYEAVTTALLSLRRRGR
jgi:hypothetical protein